MVWVMWEEFKMYSWAFRYVTDEERFFSSLKEGLGRKEG